MAVFFSVMGVKPLNHMDANPWGATLKLFGCKSMGVKPSNHWMQIHGCETLKSRGRKSISVKPKNYVDTKIYMGEKFRKSS